MGTQSIRPEDSYSKFGVYWRPYQDFVYISRRFYSDWEDVIHGRDDVFAIDPTGYAIQVIVGFKEGRPAFTKGFQDIDDFYSLKGKSFVKFKYVQPLTFYFRIIDEDGEEIEYPNQAVVPEVINLESDSESVPILYEEVGAEEVAPPTGGDINWEKVVTQRIVQGRDPLNLPAPLVEKLVQSGQTVLTVRVLNRNLVRDCNIRRAKRNKNEACLF